MVLAGVVALALFLLASGQGLPAPVRVVATPVWMWTAGGLLGATFVASMVLLAPKLGATLLLGAAVAGQLTTALLMDHYGLLGYPQHSISPGRVAGVLLIFAGVYLVRRF